MLEAVEFYATQSPVSDPGVYAALFDAVPHDLAGIASAVQGLVYHFFADEKWFGWHPPQERMPEVDTRYIEAILSRLMAMNNHPLTEPRAHEDKMIGCCRDFSLLACSMLRHQGVPARVRHGFSGYFVPDYWIDHVVVEVWEDGRWRRFDPELPATGNFGFDVLDMPEGPFITGGRAWQMCRNEGPDPARFGLGPDRPEIAGWQFVQGEILLDCAALNKQEMLCWDGWGYGNQETPLADDETALLDRVAALSIQPDSTELRALVATHPRLRVPETVLSYSPAVGPHEVSLAAVV